MTKGKVSNRLTDLPSERVVDLLRAAERDPGPDSVEAAIFRAELRRRDELARRPVRRRAAKRAGRKARG